MLTLKAGLALAAAAAIVAACGPVPGAPMKDPLTKQAMAMDTIPEGSPKEPAVESRLDMNSSAFAHDGLIPKRYTADGENVSPPLAWTAGPSRTLCYAIVMTDPDAPSGVWTHWVLWNQVAPRLDENVPPAPQLPSGAAQGTNSWSKSGYRGPEPDGGTRRYVFRVYALDARLDLPPSAGRADVERAIENHVLATGELAGRYTHDK